jgi:mannose-6-phosphate isomerase
VKPLELGPNQIRRFYRGGARIESFRGLPPSGEDAPEDWVASTTTVFGEPELGLSRVGGGVRVADLLAGDPEAFFEPAHLGAYGADPTILIKLLDAGERLPLHFHPDDGFAAERLRAPHGKTEAWVILEADADAVAHVGFAHDLGEDELAHRVAARDVEGLVAAMNRLPVRAGDAIFVPAGLPHVIGEGILLLELQQPSDLSLLLEWSGVMTEEQAWLGLPREVALGAATRTAVDLGRLTGRRGSALFPAEADPFFRAELVAGGARFDPAFSVVVVTAGEGALRAEHAEPVALRRGSTVLVPFASGTVEIAGEVEAIRCRPPVPPRLHETPGPS